MKRNRLALWSFGLAVMPCLLYALQIIYIVIYSPHEWPVYIGVTLWTAIPILGLAAFITGFVSLVRKGTEKGEALAWIGALIGGLIFLLFAQNLLAPFLPTHC